MSSDFIFKSIRFYTTKQIKNYKQTYLCTVTYKTNYLNNKHFILEHNFFNFKKIRVCGSYITAKTHFTFV